jgi:flagellar basal-body rod protein FlgG
LRIVTFNNLKGLAKVGSSLFKPTSPNTTPRPAENTLVKQGYLESSNVNAIRMMTDMIAEMRMVEAYQKMIRTADTANTKAINELGRIA